jgi:ABC-type branched-subunit amino acid transport system ATPase component
VTENYVGRRRTSGTTVVTAASSSGPSPEEVAARIAAAGGRARFAGRVALGVYGDGDIPAWNESVRGASREQVRGLTSLAVAESAPLVALLLLLPQVAEVAQISTAVVGAVVILPLFITLFAVFPAASAGAGRRRVAVALGCGINLAVIGVVVGQAFAPPILAALLTVRAILSVFTWASARPLLVDSVVPEARVRALTRWRTSWLLGAGLGAFGAAMATVGPSIGPALAISGTSVLAALVAVLALGVKDPGPGGVESQRVSALFGPEVAADLAAPTAGSAALGRVVRTKPARVTLTGYVAVGYGLIGMLVPAHAAIFERGAESGVTPGIAALGLSAAMIVATLPVLMVGRNIERMRRRSAGEGAQPAFVGTLVMLAGIVALSFSPVAPALPAAYALCAVGAMITAIALDGVLFSVVAPGDRPAAAALSGMSTAAGGVIGYGVVAITTAQTGNLGTGFLAAAVPMLFFLLGSRRPARMATAGLDDAVGAEAEESVLNALEGEDAVIPVLAARTVNYSYGSVQALFGVDLVVRPGELVALLGPNGVGKTTLLRVLSGLAKPSSGAVLIDGRDISTTSAPERVAMGLSQIVGGQAVFGSMTVADNLRMFGYSLGKDRKAVEAGIEEAYAVFPRLSDRRSQLASTLSGGEQQMLGLSKALIVAPRVLLIDEFSLGLAPVIVGQLMETVRRLNERGTAVLLVEQSVNVALSLVDRVYFMEKGRITFEGRAEDLRADPELVAALSMGGAHAEELAAVEHGSAEHDSDTHELNGHTNGHGSAAAAAAVVAHEVADPPAAEAIPAFDAPVAPEAPVYAPALDTTVVREVPSYAPEVPAAAAPVVPEQPAYAAAPAPAYAPEPVAPTYAPEPVAQTYLPEPTPLEPVPTVEPTPLEPVLAPEPTPLEPSPFAAVPVLPAPGAPAPVQEGTA